MPSCPWPPFLRKENQDYRMESTATFAHDWSAEVLKTAPLIAPARQYTYPQQIAGEEDALARGALQLLVRPATAGTFPAPCALGFTHPAMPSGACARPKPRDTRPV